MIQYLWKLFLARFRFSQKAICEMSKGRSKFDDFHDYPDSIDGKPYHFQSHICKFCGKEFII